MKVTLFDEEDGVRKSNLSVVFLKGVFFLNPLLALVLFFVVYLIVGSFALESVSPKDHLKVLQPIVCGFFLVFVVYTILWFVWFVVQPDNSSADSGQDHQKSSVPESAADTPLSEEEIERALADMEHLSGGAPPSFVISKDSPPPVLPGGAISNKQLEKK